MEDERFKIPPYVRYTTRRDGDFRDEIAIEAMKVILAQHKFTRGNEPEDVLMVAEAAYIMADAMLKEREIKR